MRLADILTTASAIANYTGELNVSPIHLLHAIDILAGEKTIDDLGRPVSPLIPRPPGSTPGADPAVRDLAQRWFAESGNDINAELDDFALARLRTELHALA